MSETCRKDAQLEYNYHWFSNSCSVTSSDKKKKKWCGSYFRIRREAANMVLKDGFLYYKLKMSEQLPVHPSSVILCFSDVRLQSTFSYCVLLLLHIILRHGNASHNFQTYLYSAFRFLLLLWWFHHKWNNFQCLSMCFKVFSMLIIFQHRAKEPQKWQGWMGGWTTGAYLPYFIGCHIFIEHSRNAYKGFI